MSLFDLALTKGAGNPFDAQHGLTLLKDFIQVKQKEITQKNPLHQLNRLKLKWKQILQNLKN